MQYKMPYQKLDRLQSEIIAREVLKQKLSLVRATPQHLKELAEVAFWIRKTGIPSYLVCKKLPGTLGAGIFLRPEAKPLLKGQIIAPYSGTTVIAPQNVIDDSLYAFEPLSNMHLTREEQKKIHPEANYHPRRLYSVQIDAEKRGNFTRFINHSEKPNIAAELMKIPPNSLDVPDSPLAVIYRVEKKINPGEQLLISYDGDDHSYWSALDIKPFPLFARTFYLEVGKNTLKTRSDENVQLSG